MCSYLPYSRLSSEPDDQEHQALNPCQKLIQPPDVRMENIKKTHHNITKIMTEDKDFIS